MWTFLGTTCFLFLLSHSANALVTITCEQPTGVRVDISDRGPETNRDSFSGVYPKFILDQDNPTNLVVLFSATKIIGPTRHNKASTATIIMNKAQQITAVELMPREVWMYSLFPNRRVGFFTRTSHNSLDGSVHSAIFYSRCEFGAK